MSLSVALPAYQATYSQQQPSAHYQCRVTHPADLSWHVLQPKNFASDALMDLMDHKLTLQADCWFGKMHLLTLLTILIFHKGDRANSPTDINSRTFLQRQF